ncbi:hypothetical protein H2200_004509 [Cladophialophora chaetospira]|uniref:C3H1-type domain-containing protein n=1 Tax=Cladophialophora chaetospira TaxID=386627 RepID=A0AA38XDD6_9EURO|nr:hypothetical protein H2200_004509 [Cladophialophora chaetospira]
MDPSTNASMNGTQHTNGQPYNSILDGIQNYAGSDSIPSGEDIAGFFDPELFDTTVNNGFSQASLSMSQDFDINGSRQSHTPEIHQYGASQQNFSQHQFPPQFYNSQQMNQSTFDPRLYSRPSPSPVGFDGGYSYQSQMGYTPQNFSAQQMNIPQRQTQSSSQNYPPRQQPSPFVNIAQRPSQLPHVQNTDLMRYGSFQLQDQQHQSNRFVDPSLLTANQTMHSSNTNNNTFQPQQSYMHPSYFRAESTLDPRSMQGLQSLQALPPAKSPQPGNEIHLSFGSKVTNAVVIIPKSEQPAKAAPTANKDPTAPKRPRGRPRKDASVQSGAQAAASESSDDELEIEDDDPPEMTPALLSLSMPQDERGKTLYRAIQAVWSPRNKSVDPEKIRAGIAQFGDVIRGLRDAWKTRNETLRKAELPNSSTSADASRLKEEVARYRQLLEMVMLRSLQYGHLGIVKRLGENQFTMSALSSFMLDRFNVSDFDSALTSAILKFVSRFETLDSEMLEMTKLSKILQRLTKKATNEIKSLAQAVLDNAASASAKKASGTGDKKADKPASPRSIGSPAGGPRKDAVAGVKRPREGDAAAQPTAKKVTKVIPPSSKPLAVRLEEKRKAEEAAKRAKAGEKAATPAAMATSTSAAGSTVKSKVAVAAPPKSSIFAALSSVPKKPGTSNAERAAAAAKEKVMPAAATASTLGRPPKKESPPRNVGPAPVVKSATSSSFLGVLLDMEKKPEKEVKKEVEIPNETEEQKAKRLRKESRRRLRVSWKADDKLVETRFFTHDPDEELGQGDRLKANAGGGREGEALKLHKNMDDEDDEDDEDSFDEFEPYTPPSEVDFTYLEDPSLGEDSPHKTNSPKFGGSLKPESRSREAQDKYEQDTLMAIYTSKGDRPPTPKELDDTKEEDDFEPAEPETPFGDPSEQTRLRESDYLAHRTRPQPQPPIDLNALAQAMAAQPRPQQQSAGLTPELQRALGMFSQPTPAPQAAPAANLQAILQSVLGPQMQAQAPQAQYPVATQPATYAPNNLSAMLASMQQASQTPSTANALPLGIGGNPNPFPGGFDDPPRKHARTDSNGNDEEYGRKGGNKKKKGEAKPYNYKTQVCTFWEQGKCLKGESCTYRHGEED